jgi:hypothetical protein
MAQNEMKAMRGMPLRVRSMEGCTPDMGMSLWGESPLWEDVMESG